METLTKAKLEEFLTLKYSLKGEELISALNDKKWEFLTNISFFDIESFVERINIPKGGCAGEVLIPLWQETKSDMITITIPNKPKRNLFFYIKGAAIFPPELEEGRFKSTEVDRLLYDETRLIQTAIASFHQHQTAVEYIRHVAITNDFLDVDHEILNKDDLNPETFQLYYIITDKTITSCSKSDIWRKKNKYKVLEIFDKLLCIENDGNYRSLV